MSTQVLQIDPITMVIEKKILIPAAQVISLAWGGPNLDLLYVTTSRKGLSYTELQNYPLSGATFAISNLDKTSGYPGDNYISYM